MRFALSPMAMKQHAMGFNHAVKSACLLRMYADNQNQEFFWQYALQIVKQLDTLWSESLPILAPIVADFPDAPFKTLDGILAPLPYFGNDGHPGYTYSSLLAGPHHSHDLSGSCCRRACL